MQRLSSILVLLAACGGAPKQEPAAHQAPEKPADAAQTATAKPEAAMPPTAEPPPPDDGPGVAVGDIAPPFTLPDDSGTEVSLDQYRDQRAVLLAFYPKDFTGG